VRKGYAWIENQRKRGDGSHYCTFGPARLHASPHRSRREAEMGDVNSPTSTCSPAKWRILLPLPHGSTRGQRQWQPLSRRPPLFSRGTADERDPSPLQQHAASFTFGNRVWQRRFLRRPYSFQNDAVHKGCREGRREKGMAKQRHPAGIPVPRLNLVRAKMIPFGSC
jgi:hypothetical protein